MWNSYAACIFVCCFSNNNKKLLLQPTGSEPFISQRKNTFPAQQIKNKAVASLPVGDGIPGSRWILKDPNPGIDLS